MLLAFLLRKELRMAEINVCRFCGVMIVEVGKRKWCPNCGRWAVENDGL